MGKARKRTPRVNALGLSKADYNGRPTTLCKGCGHNSIANQIVQIAYELSIDQSDLVKLSGIGCSFWTMTPETRVSVSGPTRKAGSILSKKTVASSPPEPRNRPQIAYTDYRG